MHSMSRSPVRSPSGRPTIQDIAILACVYCTALSLSALKRNRLLAVALAGFAVYDKVAFGTFLEIVRHLFTLLHRRVVCTRKMAIPKAIKEQVWLRDNGHQFQGKCKTRWCRNKVTVFDFHCGHDIPASKGGVTTLDNIVVLCARCNLSMGNHYTFREWNHTNPSVSCWKSCTAVSPVCLTL